MSEEYTPDLYTLEDEDGNEQVFEMLDVMEYEGEKYYALTPYYENPDEALGDDGEVVILKSDFDGDEEIMVSIDDDEEYERHQKAEIGLNKKYRDDKQHREQKFYSRVKIVHERRSRIILSESYVLKHFPPPLRLFF